MKMNTLSKGFLPLIVVVAALQSGPVAAGTFAVLPWIDDSDLSFINTSTTWTHKVEVVPQGTSLTDGAAIPFLPAGGVTINSVVFDGLQTNITSASNAFVDNPSAVGGPNFTISLGIVSSTSKFFYGGAALDPTTAGTASTSLKTGIFASGGVGSTNEITLTGLAADTDYSFYYFNANWSDSARGGTIDGSDDGIGTNTFTLDQSALNRDAQIVRYDYNTGAETSITFQFINGPDGGIHNYAFMNSVVVVPEPSTLALLLLAGFLGVVRRRR